MMILSTTILTKSDVKNLMDELNKKYTWKQGDLKPVKQDNKDRNST